MGKRRTGILHQSPSGAHWSSIPAEGGVTVLLFQSLPDDASVKDVDPMNPDLFSTRCRLETLIRRPSRLS